MADSGAPVLIVEDERIVARDLQRTLLGFGYDAFAIAASCEEALARAAEKCPAVVLMDIRIKGELDGIATARMLRERFASAVVYLTSHADPDTLQRATATEPSGYLQKPVRPAELRSAIEISLHKREVEARWRDGERWIESGLGSIEDAIVAVHPSGRILEINGVAAEWLGKRAPELRGALLTDVLHMIDPGLGVTLPDPTLAALREGREQRGRARLMRHDGSEQAVRYRVQPVVAHPGNRVLGALLAMVARDESHERQSLSADSDLGFRVLVDRAPVGIFVHREGKFAYLNRAFCASLGYEHCDELIGRSVIDTVAPSARPGILDRMKRVAAGEAGTPSEVPCVRKDGRTAYLEGTGFPLIFQGEPATVVVMQDITARHAMDAALQENEARYRHLFSDSPIALWEADFSAIRSMLDEIIASGVSDLPAYLRAHPEFAGRAIAAVKILEVNDATLGLCRAEGREELRESLPRIFGPESHPVFLEAVCFLSRGAVGTFVAETRVRTLRGDSREIELRATLLPGYERSFSRVLLSLFDTTEFKAAERDLRSSLREKDVLLKEVHHRVKNNLQVISSLLSLQAMQMLDPSVRERLIESQNRVQAIALVHEKLYRSEQLSHIAFSEYAKTLIFDLMHTHGATSRSIDLVLEMDDEVRISVDAAIPCGLMLNELVSNALKHAFPDPRTGTLRIRFARNAGRVSLVVEDDGVGLPPGLDPRMSATLGLDLVFTFAEQLEADVSVGPGPGTRFVITFAENGRCN